MSKSLVFTMVILVAVMIAGIPATVMADIKEGYHTNADARQVKPFEDFKPYPTKVTVVDADPGLTMETPRFPWPCRLKCSMPPEI